MTPRGGTAVGALPRAGRILWNVAMTLSLTVGGLQMFRVPAGPLTDHGAGVFGTAWLYAIIRQGRNFVQRRRPATPEGAAIIVLFGCFLSEFAQQWEMIPGIFDPYDLLAYTGTVGACYLVDKRVTPLA